MTTHYLNYTLSVATCRLTQVPATQPPLTPSTTTASSMLPSPHPSHSSTGAIAGGTVGGLALLTLVAGCILFCVKRKPRGVNRRGQSTVEIDGRTVNTSPKQGGLCELSEDRGRQPEGPQEMFQDNALEMYQDNIKINAERSIAELGAEER